MDVAEDFIRYVVGYVLERCLDELAFFEKQYKFKININSDNSLIIPEYKIQLFNKSKKIINQIENFKIIGKEHQKKNNFSKNINKKNIPENLNKNKKKIIKGLGKTLWVRRKKNKSN